MLGKRTPAEAEREGRRAGVGPPTGWGQDSGSCRAPRRAGSAQQRTLGRRCWAASEGARCCGASWKNLGRGVVAGCWKVTRQMSTEGVSAELPAGTP